MKLKDICTMSMCRALHESWYMIMVEDTDRTFNINMHTFDCYALSEEEAIGKMYKQRPEFRHRKITSIKNVDAEMAAIENDEQTETL